MNDHLVTGRCYFQYQFRRSDWLDMDDKTLVIVMTKGIATNLSDTVRILHGADSMHAYEQLMQLQIEIKQDRIVYKCPAGHHDDLAISCAMMVWAAKHPHLDRWCWPLEPRRPSRSADASGDKASRFGLE